MDELLARQLPMSPEAEQSVIGSMMVDPNCIPEVIELLHSDDFYVEENRRIYEIIYIMFNEAARIDPVTVLDRLKQAGLGFRGGSVDLGLSDAADGGYADGCQCARICLYRA